MPVRASVGPQLHYQGIEFAAQLIHRSLTFLVSGGVIGEKSSESDANFPHLPDASLYAFGVENRDIDFGVRALISVCRRWRSRYRRG